MATQLRLWENLLDICQQGRRQGNTTAILKHPDVLSGAARVVVGDAGALRDMPSNVRAYSMLNPLKMRGTEGPILIDPYAVVSALLDARDNIEQLKEEVAKTRQTLRMECLITSDLKKDISILQGRVARLQKWAMVWKGLARRYR